MASGIRSSFGFVCAIALGAVAPVACSAGGSDAEAHHGAGAGAGAGAGGEGAGTSSGGAAGTIGLDSGSSGGSGGAGGSTTLPDGGCVGVSSAAQSVVTLEPIALLVMQDRSGSMVSGFPAGSPQSWPNSVAALHTFVTDPASAGLDVGLGFFPPIVGPDLACGGCDKLAVPIGPIAQTGPMIDSAMSANTPNPVNFTPLQCGLGGMINGCLAYTAQHNEPCVAVFVTDGNTSDPAPVGCDTNVADLLKIVSDGNAKGVKTFALGLVTGALTFVNEVAQAGGTTSGFDISQGGTQAFVSALNAIRTSVVVQTTLPCQWTIPPPPNGQSLDPTKVNLQLTPAPGSAPQSIAHVGSASDCAAAGGGWYYDDSANPTQVIACPETCATLTSSTQGTVDLVFGCDTVEAPK